jgi:hypothetical protein
MWGVLYSDPPVADAVTAKLAVAHAGDIVIVPPPTWLLFELTSVDPASWPAELSLVPGKVVIPLRPFAKGTKALSLPSPRFPSLSKLHLKYQESVFQGGYCVTIHKLQGVTAKRVVADIHRSRALVTQSVVVVLSRVRRAAHLRLVPGDLSFLESLRHDPDLAAFVSCLTPLPRDSAVTHPQPLPVCMFDLHAYKAYTAAQLQAHPQPQPQPHRHPHRDAGAGRPQAAPKK